MNSTSIRRISLAVVIGLAMLVVSLGLIGLSAAPAQAAETSHTEDLVEGAINQPGQLPPEQITSQPYTTHPTVLDGPDQTVDLDGDGGDDASFQALRVRIEPDTGRGRGRLTLETQYGPNYELDVHEGRVIADDDGIPTVIYLSGEGQKTFGIRKWLRPLTWEATVRRGEGGMYITEGMVIFEGVFNFDMVIEAPATTNDYSFAAEGRIARISTGPREEPVLGR
jgi:hypothetical protein